MCKPGIAGSSPAGGFFFFFFFSLSFLLPLFIHFLYFTSLVFKYTSWSSVWTLFLRHVTWQNERSPFFQKVLISQWLWSWAHWQSSLELISTIIYTSIRNISSIEYNKAWRGYRGRISSWPNRIYTKKQIMPNQRLDGPSSCSCLTLYSDYM